MTVRPLDPDIAVRLLTIGLFAPVYYLPNRDTAKIWERKIEEEEGIVKVTIETEQLVLNLSPAISSFYQHQGKRRTAGVYFEFAARYAEHVGGIIVQHANVIGCKSKDALAPTDRVLANYPDMPLLWENVCPGFQALLVTLPEDRDETVAVDRQDPHHGHIDPAEPAAGTSVDGGS
jgi:hypothetical protein